MLFCFINVSEDSRVIKSYFIPIVLIQRTLRLYVLINFTHWYIKIRLLISVKKNNICSSFKSREKILSYGSFILSDEGETRLTGQIKLEWLNQTQASPPSWPSAALETLRDSSTLWRCMSCETNHKEFKTARVQGHEIYEVSAPRPRNQTQNPQLQQRLSFIIFMQTARVLLTARNSERRRDSQSRQASERKNKSPSFLEISNQEQEKLKKKEGSTLTLSGMKALSFDSWKKLLCKYFVYGNESLICFSFRRCHICSKDVQRDWRIARSHPRAVIVQAAAETLLTADKVTN